MSWRDRRRGLLRPGLVAAALVGICATSVGVRRRLARWGATQAEARRMLLGDDLIPKGRATATNAITIAAPPEDVWPWIVQIGRGRHLACSP